MRILTVAGWLLVLVAPCLAAEDLLSDLRAEVAAATATATLKSSTQPRGDGGALYVSHNLRLAGAEATYELAYKSFLPPNDSRNQRELNDWAGGLGMVQPSDKGWYTNGFVMVTLADPVGSVGTADHCARVRIPTATGKLVDGEFAWQLATGEVTLRFFLLAARPELFLLVTTARPRSPEAHLEITFQCYPGGFVSPFDRWVHTARQAVQHAGPTKVDVTLDPAQERWMVLADHYAGVTPRPMGPCSVATEAAGVVRAGARIDSNYSVRPSYVLAPGRTEALFAIREFTPMSWQSAVQEVAATSDEALAAARQALASPPR